SGAQQVFRLAEGARDVAGFQPGGAGPNLGLDSPIPVQEKPWCNAKIANVREIAVRMLTLISIEFRIPGGNHGDRPGLHGVLFRIAAHHNLTEPSHPVEIEAERA